MKRIADGLIVYDEQDRQEVITFLSLFKRGVELRECREGRERMFREYRTANKKCAFKMPGFGGGEFWCFPREYDWKTHHDTKDCGCQWCSDRGDEGPRYYYEDEGEE